MEVMSFMRTGPASTGVQHSCIMHTATGNETGAKQR
jgi:hypothetical protein